MRCATGFHAVCFLLSFRLFRLIALDGFLAGSCGRRCHTARIVSNNLLQLLQRLAQVQPAERFYVQ